MREYTTNNDLQAALSAMTSAQAGWLIEHFTELRNHFCNSQPELAEVANEFLILADADTLNRPQRARDEVSQLERLMADSVIPEDLPEVDGGWGRPPAREV